MSALALLAATGTNAPTYVDDVFSTFLYSSGVPSNTTHSQRIRNGINIVGTDTTGVDAVFCSNPYRGTSTDREMNVGIDLATKGGLVWSKDQSTTNANILVDTVRGATQELNSSSSAGQSVGSTGVTSFTSTGYNLGTSSAINNLYTATCAWVFARQAKFFDIVTWTGDGAASKTLNHNLGVAPGFITAKAYAATGSWYSYHRSLGATQFLTLNLTDIAQTSSNTWNNTAPTSTQFTVGSTFNTNGVTYIAYLFAHDSATDGIIQCGSFSTDGSGNATVNIGWEPQWILLKRANVSSNWFILDTHRGLKARASSGPYQLHANASDAEAVTTFPNVIGTTSTGLSVVSDGTGVNYVYVAIRKPTYSGGAGGLVWTRERTANAFGNHLFDTARGLTNRLVSNSTSGSQTTDNQIYSFNSDGFTLGHNAASNFGVGVADYISWTFKKAPKFFDFGTYTGNGSAPRAISHSLGVSPGVVIVRRTDSSGGNWWVFHRSAPNQGAAYPGIGGNLYLDTTDGADNGTNPFLSAVSASTFTLSTNQNSVLNVNTGSYVWYAFAHDATADGMIQCGSVTCSTVSVPQDVNLGWEPQWVLTKDVSRGGPWWQIECSESGLTWPGGAGKSSYPNSSGADQNTTQCIPTATGFQLQANNTTGTSPQNGDTFVYVAIRRRNKPPTSGKQVYYGVVTSASNIRVVPNFTVDLMIRSVRAGWSNNALVVDRMRGANYSVISTNAAEVASNNSFIDGPTNTFKNSVYGQAGIEWLFRRAPGVFNIVCYTGNGAAGRVLTHGLGAVPEFVIIKGRAANSGGNHWATYNSAVSPSHGYLNLGNAYNTFNWIGSPTETTITIGTANTNTVNENGATYVAYLFATKAGISKVGSYSGNGSSQTIDCGFASGARFVLIKRTDTSGFDWWVLDSIRGIVAGNDPLLFLNQTWAEDTSGDYVDPASSGFTVNNLGGFNTNGGTYVYLAFA